MKTYPDSGLINSLCTGHWITTKSMITVNKELSLLMTFTRCIVKLACRLLRDQILGLIFSELNL
ncbi:unnamed protein product [Brugia timori]|uniref:Uncharacterized protein n=1 Tax=Brugia timori TaxID=42155 RepID=A0A3P7W5F0_9BILA|nr:unnamed protein product [Brugia timori]